MDRVSESRIEVERALEDIRRAMGREVGIVPRAVGWILPLAAFSVGLSLAVKILRRRRSSRPAE